MQGCCRLLFLLLWAGVVFSKVEKVDLSTLAEQGKGEAGVECGIFVTAMVGISNHDYHGPAGSLVKAADTTLCNDLGNDFREACIGMVEHHTLVEIPRLARKSPSVFCAHLKAGRGDLATAHPGAETSLESKQALGDEMLLQLAVADENDESDEDSKDDSDDDDDDEDDDDEDDAQVALQDIEYLIKKRGDKKAEKGGKGGKGKKGEKKRANKKDKKNKKNKKSNKNKAEEKMPESLRDSLHIAKQSEKLHNTGLTHLQQMMVLHEMAMMSGMKTSPVSTTGISFDNVDKDLYQPDAPTTDVFSDGASLNQDLTAGRDDDDSDEMTMGTYDDPWLTGANAGLAEDRELAFDPGHDPKPGTKGDLKLWLEGVQRQMLFGNPNRGLHGIGMGMNPGGIFAFGEGTKQRRRPQNY